MISTRIRVTAALIAALVLASEANAQLFGDRVLGRTQTPRARPTSGNRLTSANRAASTNQPTSANRSDSPLRAIGQITGRERYLRENRDASDFVGTDVQDRQSFVGVQQADADVQIESAVDGLRIETGTDANRAQPATTRQRVVMYQPRLRVDFRVGQPSSDQVSLTLVDRLRSSLLLDETSWIEVSVEGRTAILRGEVASERTRSLARLLLLFEPGISDVRNELAVRPPPAAPQENRPTGPSSPPGDRRPETPKT